MSYKKHLTLLPLSTQSAYILNEIEGILDIEFNVDDDKWFEAVDFLEKQFQRIRTVKK